MHTAQRSRHCLRAVEALALLHNSFSLAQSKNQLHFFGGFTLQRWQDVAIRVHRQADLAVAECLHHNAWMYVPDEQQRGACVSQVVKTHRRQAGLVEESMKPMGDVRSIGERASVAGEDQVEIDPAISCGEPFNDLTGAVSA